MNLLSCPSEMVEETLSILKKAGKTKKERGVFWLARLSDAARVAEVYEPAQKTSKTLFWLAPSSMKKLMRYLRENKLIAVAQVHSHPWEAFHSETDDDCAILGQVGAASIVVPFFARDVTVESFLEEAAFFYLSSSGRWTEAPTTLVSKKIIIGTP